MIKKNSPRTSSLCKTLLAIIFLTAFSLIGYGQTVSKDHLRAQRLYEKREYVAAENLMSQVLESYSKLQDTSLLIQANADLGSAIIHQWRTDEAIEIYIKSQRLAKEYNDISWIADLNDRLASVLIFDDRSDTVELLLNESLSLDTIRPELKSNAYMFLSEIYKTRLLKDTAMILASKAFEIDSILSDSSSMPFTSLGLGSIHWEQGDNEEAIRYLLYGEQFLRAGKDDFKRATFMDRFSSIFFSMGNLPKARNYAEESIRLCEQLNLNSLKVTSYYQLAQIEEAYENYEAAIANYNIADSINSTVQKKYMQGLILVGRSLAKISLGSKLSTSEISELSAFKQDIQDDRINLRLKILDLAMKAENLPVTSFENNYNDLATELSKVNVKFYDRLADRIAERYYSSKGLWADAYRIKNKLETTRNHIYEEQTNYTIYDLEAKYKKDIKDREILLLNRENEAKTRVVNIQTIMLVIGSLLLLTISFLSYFVLKSRKLLAHQNNIISSALNEKEMLLKEIHHRVKNNLQVISSLLRIQTNQTQDQGAIDALKEGQSRVHSMSLIHQDLYQHDDLSRIEIKSYLGDLSRYLFQTYNVTNDRIDLLTDIATLQLDVDTVVPIGLITNELITNALKYAFPQNKSGTITLSLKEKNDNVELCVSDNGIGLDPELTNNGSFGQGLIQAFVRKLKGQLDVDGTKGTSITITFPRNHV